MTTRVIPWPEAAQWTMDVQLSRSVYTLRGRWNTRMGTWLLDLETGDGVRILSGIRVVLEYPLLPRWRSDDMPPGELFVVCPTGRCNTDPGRDEIGQGRDLRFVYTVDD